MGLQLKNPIIISSSGLTNSPAKIKQLEDHGAAAVILKSIFEEQINQETSAMLRNNDFQDAANYLSVYAKSQSVSAYLDLIEKSKKSTTIPIIGSINCVSTADWTDFALQMQNAGADAVELNIHIVPTDRNLTSAEHEQKYLDIVHQVKQKIQIPICVKIGQHFTNMVNFVDKLSGAGASAVTLFNRFYHPDIDIDKMEISSFNVFSNADDLKFSLRWVAIISGKVKNIELSASTGIHDAAGIIKQLLAGAQTTQICSVVYKNSPDIIGVMLNEVNAWMIQKGFKKISELRGRFNSSRVNDPAVYERSQFMKYFSNFE